MLPYRDTALIRTALIVFFIAVVGYAYYEARAILWGPAITVPEKLSIVHEQVIMVRGTARHIASLSMNGNEIPVTEAGEFAHQYLLAPGYNRIVLDAEDKYGATTQQVVEVVYDAPKAPILPATTTSATSSTPAESSAAPDAPESGPAATSSDIRVSSQ
ncbi:hypothetical protein FJY94_02635 [Candidatus Kaiserbacteria bacterium]|nr:hypothetical protein [Candidatus Kaiserbacteria bacterium]